MSVWKGDAEFQNLNLNLDVVNKELNLPVELISGHIHELKITVPWTSVTSEPIVVNVNTIGESSSV
jgi:vacuolar protein sorting-associated protein 13B